MSEQETKRLDGISDVYLSEVIQDSAFDLTTAYKLRTIVPDLTGETALELGCGEGAVTPLLARTFPKVTVVDASAQLLDRLRDRLGGDNVEYVESLFEEFETEQRFDVVLLLHVLEHVEDPVAIMSRAAQWLAPGGRMLLSVPNAESVHRLLGVQLGMLDEITQLNDLDRALGHRRVYSFETFKQDVERAGLQVTSEQGIFLKAQSSAQIAQWTDEQREACFELGKLIQPRFCAEIYVVARRS